MPSMRGILMSSTARSTGRAVIALQRAFAVGVGADLEALLLQGHGDAGEDVAVVIDQGDGLLHALLLRLVTLVCCPREPGEDNMRGDCGALRMERERNMAPQTPPPAWAARLLLRAARSAALATLGDGQPYVSLVTPACAGDLSVLLLLSSLAAHTRHLSADPRCSLLVVGAPEGANPQTAPRLSLTGLAAPEADPALKVRWLAVHPYGASYADFADFAIWRLRPERALFVAGFARANQLRWSALMPDSGAVSGFAAGAAAVLAQCNRDHMDTLGRIAYHAGGEGPNAPWRLVGIDVDGCDLGLGEQVLRLAWTAPLADPSQVGGELTRLASAAGQATNSG